MPQPPTPFFLAHLARCFEFCVSQGLDLFALVENDECRCGATRLNAAVWGANPRPGLMLPAALSDCMTGDTCPMRVYRWLGPFESGGSVGARLLKPNAAATAYVDSVVAGRRLTPAQEEDGIPLDGDADETADAASALVQGGTGNPMWERPCNDNPGCQAGRPWNRAHNSGTRGYDPTVGRVCDRAIQVRHRC